MDDALITLGNYLIENFARLENGMATGCRCLSCSSWQIIDLNDKLLAEADTLEELVKEISK